MAQKRRNQDNQSKLTITTFELNPLVPGVH